VVSEGALDRRGTKSRGAGNGTEALALGRQLEHLRGNYRTRPPRKPTLGASAGNPRKDVAVPFLGHKRPKLDRELTNSGTQTEPGLIERPDLDSASVQVTQSFDEATRANSGE